MGKQKYFFAFIILITASCSTLKKVQVIEDALSKNDTTKSQLIAEIKKVDSLAIVKNILNKINLAKLDYKTMNTRIKVQYESEQSSYNFIANVSMIKDSQIFITLRADLGIIVMKALIRKDSVFIISPTSKTKTLDRQPISYLQQVVKIPFTFSTIQDLMLGNPIFLDSSSIVAYKSNNNKLQLSLIGALFKNLVILSEDNSKVLHLKLDDIDINQHRTCDIAYSNHVSQGQYYFPLNRVISINAQNKLDIYLEIKEYSFNEPVKYTFAIPKPGKRK
ncbi:MAG: DUF4292 domain-containing protein [Bacteroidetes bacterium]|nr:DUF4292 domain-containing protein [Bacteroidota bacterium]